MKNKQKAWRLGAAVMRSPARAQKALATVLGSALRENPGLLRHVMRRREAEGQRLAPVGGELRVIHD